MYIVCINNVCICLAKETKERKLRRERKILRKEREGGVESRKS